MEPTSGRRCWPYFAVFGLAKLAIVVGLVAGGTALWSAMNPSWPAWQRAALVALAVFATAGIFRGLARAFWWRRFKMAGAGAHGCGPWGACHGTGEGAAPPQSGAA